MPNMTLAAQAVLLCSVIAPPEATPMKIDVTAKTVKRAESPLFSVGSDRAMIFLREEHQRDLMTLQKACGFKYLRCHGIFNEEMKTVVRNQDGSLSYDWTRVDAFIDQLAKAKLKPFVEFGFMPEPLASGTQTIFWWKGNVTPPKSHEEWADYITAFLRHQIAKRGLKEVRSWYFEVWNEPNLDGFWTGKLEGYYKLYESSARAVKAVDPQLRVGGPATAGMGWIPELLTYCRDNKVPLDFIASHSYAAYQGFLDEKGEGGGTVLATNPESLISEFSRAREDINKSAFPKIPLFITEWGPSYSPRDPIHDSYVCAPFILEKVRQCERVVDGISYWAFSDQFEEPGPPNEPIHGGFGLMNVDGLKKPAFYAYSFLARLLPKEIPTGNDRLIVTKEGDSFRILAWDYSPPKQDVPNWPFYHRDIPAQDLAPLSFTLSGLEPGQYEVSQVGTGYMRNDVYGEYMKLGKPKGDKAHLDALTLNKLRKASDGKAAKIKAEVGPSGDLHISAPMRTNDTWLIEVKKVG